MSNVRYFEIKLPIADYSCTGVVAILTAGENLAFGDACYLKAADSKMWKVDANAAATMPCIALSTGTIAADAEGRFLLFGFMKNNSWAWTVGGLLYPHITPGNPTQTRPSGSGDQVQIIGVAATAKIILFNPSYELVEVS